MSRWKSVPPAPRDGVDGKDADTEAVRALIAKAMADRPIPRDGRDADPAKIAEQVRAAVSQIVVKDGAAGPRGPRGFDGPMGPMPRHEWDGTRLRFEKDESHWGEWVDLRGPAGAAGGVIQLGGGNNWFPGGW